MYKATKFFLICVLCFFYACREDRGSSGSSEFEQIDAEIEKVHGFVDTGYRSQYDSIQLVLDEVEKKCVDLKYEKGIAWVYFMRGSLERWTRNYIKALEWCNKSYEMAKKLDPELETATLMEMADIYRLLEKKRLANEYYLRAYGVAQTGEDAKTRAVILSRLGDIFYLQNRYDLAMNSFKQSLAYFRQSGYKGEHNIREQQQLNNLGLCFTKLGKYDTALLYYDSALDATKYLDKTIAHVAQGVINGNKGRVYQLMNEYEKAVQLLKYNISINTQPGADHGDAITSYTYLLEIYIKLDSNRQFVQNLEKAKQLAATVDRVNMEMWRARILGLEAAYHAKIKDYGTAYNLVQQQVALNDSIVRQGEDMSLNDMLMHNELLMRTKQVKKLEEENQEKQTRYYTTIIISGLILLILILAIGVIIYYRNNNEKLKTLNLQIASQNQQISINKIDLEEAIEELKTLNSEKNRLLGMVAHDLRGPIYNITGITQLMEATMEGQDMQMIDLIKKSCENALDVINDLLEAAHFDNYGHEIAKEDANICEIIRSAINIYENRANQKGITINFNAAEEKIIANVNKEKINRLVGNLVSNAIKFSYPKGKVTITAAAQSNKVLITITDEGMGIKEEFRDIIFDKFTQAKRHGTGGEKPVGLGMSIVKQIVDSHKGRIWFESSENKGTTFYVELPLE